MIMAVAMLPAAFWAPTNSVLVAKIAKKLILLD